MWLILFSDILRNENSTKNIKISEMPILSYRGQCRVAIYNVSILAYVEHDVTSSFKALKYSYINHGDQRGYNLKSSCMY